MQFCYLNDKVVHIQIHLLENIHTHKLFQDQFDIDFLLMGSGNYPEYEAQAIANKIISVAELRKDVVAFISPYRGAFLNDSAVGQGTINSSADISFDTPASAGPQLRHAWSTFASAFQAAAAERSVQTRSFTIAKFIGFLANGSLEPFPAQGPSQSAP